MDLGSLTIVGSSHAEIKVYERARFEEEPPPPLVSGALDSKGRMTVLAPYATWVVLSPGCKTGVAVLDADHRDCIVTLEPG